MKPSVKPVCKWFYFLTWFSKFYTFYSATSTKVIFSSANRLQEFPNNRLFMKKVSFTVWICVKSKHDKIVCKRSIQRDYFTCLILIVPLNHMSTALRCRNWRFLAHNNGAGIKDCTRERRGSNLAVLQSCAGSHCLPSVSLLLWHLSLADQKGHLLLLLLVAIDGF